MNIIDDFAAGKIEKDQFLEQFRGYVEKMEQNYKLLSERLEKITSITQKNNNEITFVINRPEPTPTVSAPVKTVPVKAVSVKAPVKSARAIFTQIFTETPDLIIEHFGLEKDILEADAWKKSMAGENKAKLQKFLKEQSKNK
jgi:hypothetical protein